MIVANFLLTRFLSRSKPSTDESSFCVTPVAASVRMANANFRPRGDSRKFWSEDAATRWKNKMAGLVYTYFLDGLELSYVSITVHNKQYI